MPAYNVELYINDAILSILIQTYRAYELIIIDDGSTDSSHSIVQYNAKLDNRIKVISQKNNGLSAARNTGLKYAKGKYIYFFDSDDILKSDTFSLCIEYINHFQLDLIVFSGAAFSENKEEIEEHPFFLKPDILTPLLGQDLLTRLVSLDSYSSSACLYLFSKELVEQNNLFFDEGFLHEDEGFTPILYCSAKRAISLKTCFFMRRIRRNSIMTTLASWKNIEGCIQAVYKIESFNNRYAYLTTQTKRTLRQIQRQLLRRSIRLSDELKHSNTFIETVLKKFGAKHLFVIDSAAFFYAKFHNLFVAARSLKRWLIPKTLCWFQ